MKNLSLTLILFTLLTACSKEIAKSNYTDVIPKNATEVLILDLNALISKAGLQANELQQAKELLWGVLLENGNGTINQKINSILDNPATSGIDASAPIYLFEAPSLHTIALTLKVSDYTLLDEFIHALSNDGHCSKPTASGNHMRATIKGVGLELAYNDGTLLMVYHANQSELQRLSPAIDQLMAQPNENSIVHTEHFKQTIQIKGDIKVLATPDSMPLELRGVLSLPQGTQLVGAAMFEQGKLVALLKRADFNGEVYISAVPFRPRNNGELQAALSAMMRGKPFHLELTSNELLTVSNLRVLMEYSPNDPTTRQLYELINKIDLLTLQGDNKLCVLTLDLNNKQQNALQQLIAFVQTFAQL